MSADKLSPADLLRAKMIGEALLRELAAVPRDKWVHVSFEYKRNQDGGVLIDKLQAVFTGNEP